MPVAQLHHHSPQEAVDHVTLRDGRRIAYRRSGTGPAMVLLHGLLDSSAGWAEIVARVGRDAVAFDLPGFGDSDQPTRPRISAYVEDIAEAVELLGLERFVLVGHSLGGAVAAGLAGRMPARVDALILLAPAGFGRIHLAEAVSIPGVREATRQVLHRTLRVPGIVNLGYRTMVANGHAADAALIDRVTGRATDLVPGAVAGTQAVVAAGRSQRAFHRTGIRYDGPVVAIWGDRDRLVPPAHAAGVRAALPQAFVELWRGMGHHPQRERRDHLLRVLTRTRAHRPPDARQVRPAA